MFMQIKTLKTEKKSKMKFNEKMLKQKDGLEDEVRKSQWYTEELDNRYKELLLLSNEFNVIKKNEIPAQQLIEDDDGQVQLVQERNHS